MENKNTESYVNTKVAKKILGVHIQTLYNWDRTGKIDTIRTSGGHRMYNVSKYLAEMKERDGIIEDMIKKDGESKGTKDGKMNICYVRVSTLNQRDDLLRQKAYMEKKYPDHTVIEDIGSGINFNRRGFRKIIKLAVAGQINEVVVAHKDRLTRFGFDLIEDLIEEYSKGKIILDDCKESKKEAKDELVEDVLQILNVYTAKLNGLRKYKKV